MLKGQMLLVEGPRRSDARVEAGTGEAQQVGETKTEVTTVPRVWGMRKAAQETRDELGNRAPRLGVWGQEEPCTFGRDPLTTCVEGSRWRQEWSDRCAFPAKGKEVKHGLTPWWLCCCTRRVIR